MTAEPTTTARPILVTGAHRSGTTWVGRMLSASGCHTFVSEPLNLRHRPGLMAAPVNDLYEYICSDNEDRFLGALRQTVALRYRLLSDFRQSLAPRAALRSLANWCSFTYGRLNGRQALLKDPFAVFSADWFARRLGCQVVITIRHPAAVVSSLKRLGWPVEIEHLLRQPLLMKDWLEPQRQAMERAAASNDLIVRASILWRLVYSAVARYRDQRRPYQLVLHEELSRDPLAGYAALYGRLGLSFPPRTAARIERASGPANPPDSGGDPHAFRIDSRANLANWKRYLDRDEISRIRELTAETSRKFYSEVSWS